MRKLPTSAIPRTLFLRFLLAYSESMRQYSPLAVLLIVSGVLLCSPLAARAEFKQNLRYGMTDSASVKDLQDFLTAEGLYSGKITGSYFSFTERAVRKFQIENSIEPATGIFGPLTRKLANDILAADTASSSAPEGASDASSTDTTTGTGATTSTPSGPDSLSSTIQDLLARVQALEEIIAELTAPAPSAPTYTSTNTTPSTSTTTRTTTATTTTTTTRTSTTTTATTTTVRR